MDRTEAEIRIKELRDILWENSRKYYVDNAPSMSDYDYDQLMHELEDLENQYPEFFSPDSPTQKVGSDLEDDGGRNDFVQRPHQFPMLSLGNTYSIAEVEEFADRAVKTLEQGFSYSCELKFDGTAISLTYTDGVLTRALTRGDGVVGDDVTRNVKYISNIPQKLKGSGFPHVFEIRGEILMPYDSFDKLNEQRVRDEDQPFANPRNAASGSLKLQDPKEVGKRGLYCTLYHIPAQCADFPTHTAAMEAAASWGLPISDRSKLCHGISEIEDYISYWDAERKNLPFATDGIVIKINEIDYQKTLGYTAKFPRWAVAYKFKAEQALTKLVSIDYQVGRTGAVTPVANLDPVHLSGTMVKRATLNNADQMALLDIHIGDYVYVEKGGEIIPKITAVEPAKRPADAQLPVFPAYCPDCGTKLEKAEDEAKWFCPAQDICPTQIKGRILHFLGRKAMNVLAGDATVDQMFDKGLVRTPADLYDITKVELLQLEGWKDRSADRFLESLQKSVEVPFPRVLFALGIRHIGETTAKAVAAHFGDIDKIAAASLEELVAIPDVGDIVAKSIYDYFRRPEHIDEIARLKTDGLQFTMEAKKASSDALAGKTIVISGNFSISRDEMKHLIEDNGGKNSGSVSKKTDYLLAGSKPGPEKIKKAGDLGVMIISEDEFMAMLPSAAPAAGTVKKELDGSVYVEQELFGGII